MPALSTTFRDIDFQDVAQALKLAGVDCRFIDPEDYDKILKQLEEAAGVETDKKIDKNDWATRLARLGPQPPIVDLAATEAEDVLAFTGEIPAPPWDSGGSLIDGETAVFQGTKYWDVHNASETWSLQYHTTYDHYRYEVRAGDVWPYDSSSRSEVRDNVVRPNATPIWGAYSFLVEYPPNDSAAEWVVLGQMHDQTLVNNPAWAFEIDENGEDLIIVYRDGGAALAITMTRASPAWSADENGLYREFAPNQPRMEMNIGLRVEEGRTNSIRNPRCIGASAPTTFPTHWSRSAPAGCTVTVVGVSVENGINYLEVNIAGTTVAAEVPAVFHEPAPGIAAVAGAVWTRSAFLSIVGGSIANLTGVFIGVYEYDAASAFLRSTGGVSIAPAALTASLVRHDRTWTQGTNAAFARPWVAVSTGIGAVDITLRIGWPQLELGACLTTPILPPVGTIAASTRAVEVPSIACSLPGAYTLFAQGTPQAPSTYGVAQNIVQADNGSNNQRLVMRRVASNGGRLAALVGGTGGTILSSATLWPTNTRSRWAVSVDDGVQASSVDGAAVVKTAIATLPADVTVLHIGVNASNTEVFNGIVERITAWPFVLAEAVLEEITDPSFSDYFPEGATLDLRFDRWGRYEVHREPLNRNLWYNIVFEFRADPTGVNSILAVWRNGEKVVDLDGGNVPLGMPDATGHYWKMGVYRDAGTATDTLAVRYANTEMGSIDLSGRILNPLPLDRLRPVVVPPLDGTAPSLCASFRQRLLSSFEGVYYRLEDGSADQIDRLNDQSVNNWGSAIAGVGGTPTLVLTADVSTANFLGNDSFTNFADLVDLFADNDFYFIVRFKCTSISTDEPDSWDNDTIMGDSGRWVGISFRQPNFVLFHLDDNIAPDLKFEIPFTLNLWTTAEMYFDGAAFYGRVNGGAWTSQAVGGPIFDMTGGWRLGRGLTGKFFRGEISDFAVYPTRLTPALRDQIQAAIAA